MCATCGCGDDSGVRISTLPAQGHRHVHAPTVVGSPHEHRHDHHHDGQLAHHTPESTRTQLLEINILAKNEALAASNRRWLAERSITALNLMSSPGSGKTTLLVRTLHDLGTTRAVAVIEGDQETQLDAQRVHATGARVAQVNTGSGCHLDAEMMRAALDLLALPDGSLLFVENVGNLVCPALFDLGETARVVIVSVTEGQDKPLKYPQMFGTADLLVINKSDLLPYVDFDVSACIDNARAVNPGLRAFVLSATTGDGLAAWYAWLAAHQPLIAG
jgi:hydrogenase nickel incorporation protein HypB